MTRRDQEPEKGEWCDDAAAVTELGGSVTPKTLAQWRYQRRGPRYAKIGRRVLYRRSDLRKFLEDSIVDPTSAA